MGSKQILISGYRGTQCGEEIVPDQFSVRVHLAVWRAVFEGQKTEKCLVLGVDTPLVPVEELQKSVEVRNGKSKPTGDYAVS